MSGTNSKTGLHGLMICCIALAAPASTLVAQTFERPKATLKVAEPLAIPGAVLQPGTYSIRVMDHLSDRYIMEVAGPSSKKPTLFIGVTRTDSLGGAPGPVKWSNPADNTTYLRGWNFPVFPKALAFAYPKNDAVAIAKANNAHVPAVDPESEGMVTTGGLSSTEMQVITLWLLSPTTVGPNDPGGIKAERLSQVASLHKPRVAALPHTAGELPLIEGLGALALLGALGVGAYRRV